MLYILLLSVNCIPYSFYIDKINNKLINYFFFGSLSLNITSTTLLKVNNHRRPVASYFPTCEKKERKGRKEEWRLGDRDGSRLAYLSHFKFNIVKKNLHMKKKKPTQGSLLLHVEQDASDLVQSEKYSKA